MSKPKKAWDSQLRFELELDETEDEGRASAGLRPAPTPEEARLISEAARAALELQAGEEAPAWWEDYLKLRENGWPWRVAAYIAWAAAPKRDRKPKTLQELAETLGLTGPRQIYKWRKNHEAIDTTVAMMQTAVLFEHQRDVLEALAEMASREDYKSFNDRKLFLEMTGLYTPKSQVEVGRAAMNDLAEMSDGELDSLLGRRMDDLVDRRLALVSGDMEDEE